jgi:hypothetical protein
MGSGGEQNGRTDSSYLSGQLLTYLKLSGLSLGLIVNWNVIL